MKLDRRTAVFGAAAVLAVSAALAVTLANRKPGPSPAHKAVARYIESVNAVQQRAQVPLLRALISYRRLSFAGKTPRRGEEHRLAQAQRTLALLQQQLAAIAAPPQAARLHRLLVRLVRSEAALAVQVHSLAVYLPRLAALVAQSNAAASALHRTLATAPVPVPHTVHGTRKRVRAAQAAFAAAAANAAAQQAAALETYDAKVAVLRRKLALLEPPALLVPLQSARLRSLSLLERRGAALAAELRKRDRRNVAILGRRFAQAARAVDTVRAQQAEVGALEAYNARVAAIVGQERSIQAELARLGRLTG